MDCENVERFSNIVVFCVVGVFYLCFITFTGYFISVFGLTHYFYTQWFTFILAGILLIIAFMGFDFFKNRDLPFVGYVLAFSLMIFVPPLMFWPLFIH